MYSFAIPSSFTLYSFVTLFNPFFTTVLVFIRTYVFLIVDIYGIVFSWFKLRTRIYYFNIKTEVLGVFRYLCFIFLVLSVFFLLTLCGIFIIYKLVLLDLVPFVAIFYYYFFFFIILVYFLFSFICFEDYLLQLFSPGFQLYFFYEEKYYYGLMGITYHDTYFSSSLLDNEPKVYVSAFPVQFLQDYQYVLGGFYKTLNFDIYMQEKQEFAEQFIELFGPSYFRYLNTFHYVMDGIDLHVETSDSVWLLNSNMQFPNMSMDSVPSFFSAERTLPVYVQGEDIVQRMGLAEEAADMITSGDEQLVLQSTLSDFSSQEFFGAYPDRFRARVSSPWQAILEFRDPAFESDDELYVWQHPYMHSAHLGPKAGRLTSLVIEDAVEAYYEMRMMGSKRYLLEKPNVFMYPFEGTLSRVNRMWSSFWKRYELEFHTSMYRLSVLQARGIPKFVSHLDNKGGVLGLIEWSNSWANYFKHHSFSVEEPQDLYLKQGISDYKLYKDIMFFAVADRWDKQYDNRVGYDSDIISPLRDATYHRAAKYQGDLWHAGIVYMFMQHILLFGIMTLAVRFDSLFSAALVMKNKAMRRKMQKKVRLRLRYEEKYMTDSEINNLYSVPDMRRRQPIDYIYRVNAMNAKKNKAFWIDAKMFFNFAGYRTSEHHSIYYLHNVYDYKKQQF